MNILLLDIETTPNKVYTWGLFQQNISLDQIDEPGTTLCWAAKWLGKPGVIQGLKINLGTLHELLDEADAVVTYNGNRFDLPTLNREFLLDYQDPPAPSKSIDLYQTVKHRFRFASNKLDFVCQQLGLGSKMHHKGFNLWKECMGEGAQGTQEKAMKTMLAYNKKDVVLLERLFNHIKAWIKLPMLHETGCPSCGTKNQLERRGFYHTSVGKYQRYKCNECGTWHRDGKNLLTPTINRKRGIS